MTVIGIEKFTQRTRRLAFAAGAVAAMGAGGVFGALPVAASVAPVSHGAVTTQVQGTSSEGRAQVGASHMKGHSSLPFGVSNGQLRHMAAGESASITSDVSSIQAPDVDCYADGNGGTIVAEPWAVNDDGRNTVYFAAVLQWNGSSWVYIGATADPDDGATVQAFNDSVFGDLAEAPMDLTVVGHGLFEVVYVGESTGDSGFTSSIGDIVTPETYATETSCSF